MLVDHQLAVDLWLEVVATPATRRLRRLRALHHVNTGQLLVEHAQTRTRHASDPTCTASTSTAEEGHTRRVEVRGGHEHNTG